MNEGIGRWIKEMVVIEGFVEVEGIGREVEKLVNKGGWVDGRGVGRGVGRWVRCGCIMELLMAPWLDGWR